MLEEGSFLHNVLYKIGPMPKEALFLGIAYSDLLPILLNLWNGDVGPLMIVGDEFCGKTEFIRCSALASEIMHPPEDVQYAVITDHPEEWDGVQSDNCIGIFPYWSDSTNDFIYSLPAWANSVNNNKHSIILFMDNFEHVEELDFEVQQSIRWLLVKGPYSGVWPIVTSNGKMKKFENWAAYYFKVIIYGDIGGLFKVSAEKDTNKHFVIQEADYWLDFWIPRIE